MSTARISNRIFNSGFTFIELMLSMGIIAMLFGISSIILSNLIPRANLNSVYEILKAEVRQQQLFSMSGEKDLSDQAVEYSLLVESNQYTLFPGTVYDPLPIDSIIVEVPESIQISTDFLNNVVSFERTSGEVLNYDINNRTITIFDTLTNQSKTIILNQYGIPE